MSLLNISNLYFSHQNKNIFSVLDLEIQPHQKLVLIGPNGSGKSSLLNLIFGTLKPDSGLINLFTQPFYLRQDLDEAELKLSVLEHISLILNNSESWLAEYVLTKGELGHLKTNQKALSLSGGQKTRLSLATLLVKIEQENQTNNALLLLDEPTNNLDLAGIKWLESELKKFSGAIIIATHDRALINSIQGSIAVIESEKLKVYPCSYDEYLKLKLDEKHSAEEKYQQDIKKVTKLKKLSQDLVAKNQALGKTKYSKALGIPKISFNNQKNSSQRSLGSRTSALETKIKKIELQPPTKEWLINIKFMPNQSLNGQVLIRLKEVRKSFNQKMLFEGLSLAISAGEKTLIKGSNGSGKSTLMKIIIGQILADKGLVQINPSIKIGYFSQDVYGVELNLSLEDVLNELPMENGKAFAIAVQAGISPTDFKKPFKLLSRGQQAKIGLIKLMLDRPDVLILDEPTNHLDIKTKEAIEAAILSFSGTVILASHDRYLTGKIKFNKEISL
ncbi:MAG: ABC-F family ATP-binding cassette domain-containing protein [Candidatus Saccharimonadales bacterium]